CVFFVPVSGIFPRRPRLTLFPYTTLFRSYELFTAESELDAVYVPIGLGSGVCGVIAARDALNRKARVIGVISNRANTYRLSLDRSEEHTSELQSRVDLVCRLLLEKKNTT